MAEELVQQMSDTTDCFMPYTSAMKITAPLLASSTEQSTEQPTVDKAGSADH